MPIDEPTFASGNEPPNTLGKWIIRSGIAAVFVIFGSEKFSEDPTSHWVRLFHEIGWGDWFRYCAGVMEVVGGLLVLIPRAALVGLAMLIATMLGAVVILAFVLKQPGNSIFPGLFLVGLIGVAVWARKNA